MTNKKEREMTNKDRYKKYVMLILVCGFLGGTCESQAQAGGRSSGRAGGEAGSGGAGSGGEGLFVAPTSVHDEFHHPCDEAIGVLQNALQELELFPGNFSQKREILKMGLSDALDRIPTNEDPLTKRALQRGLILEQQFVKGCDNLTDSVSRTDCLDREQRVAVFFLQRFYNYVIESIYHLDRHYWLPYHRDYSLCHQYECLPDGFDSDFYVAYSNSARELLNFYVEVSEPLTMDLYELRVAENVFNWSAEDLNLDLFRRKPRFGCVVVRLRAAAQKLAEFNAGRRSGNSVQMVEYARGVASGSAAALSSDDCGYRY